MKSANIHEQTQKIWETNAGFWDDQVGAEGNLFHRALVSPSVLQLLDLQVGESVIEAACGNGQFAREMAQLGANVTAFDFAPTFIERAKQHTAALDLTNIAYHVIDALDETAMLALGIGRFDAAVCNMALMDIADIRPLLKAVHQLLRPDGRFVFAVSHPCFNHSGMSMVAEVVDKGELVTHQAAKINRYLSLEGQPERGIGIDGQPEAQYYFSRTLSGYLSLCFEAGFVVDGMLEPPYPAKKGKVLSWGGLPEIPPVLTVRLRKVTLQT